MDATQCVNEMPNMTAVTTGMIQAEDLHHWCLLFCLRYIRRSELTASWVRDKRDTDCRAERSTGRRITVENPARDESVSTLRKARPTNMLDSPSNVVSVISGTRYCQTVAYPMKVASGMSAVNRAVLFPACSSRVSVARWTAAAVSLSPMALCVVFRAESSLIHKCSTHPPDNSCRSCRRLRIQCARKMPYKAPNCEVANARIDRIVREDSDLIHV